MNISFWKSIEKEEEEKKAQFELSSKINKTLTECLQLIEEGTLSDEILAILSSIPEAEKFAKFWICKAKLLASKGTLMLLGYMKRPLRMGQHQYKSCEKLSLIFCKTQKNYRRSYF